MAGVGTRRPLDDWSHDLPWDAPGVYTVAAGVHRLPLPLPDQGLRAVNVYLLEDESGPVLIDSGHATTRARQSLDEGLAVLGLDERAVRRCLVTHIHRDHYTQAVELRRRQGLRIALGAGERASLAVAADESRDPLDAQLRALRACGAADLAELNRGTDHGVPPGTWEQPDDWLHKEEAVELGCRRLDVLETPGHTQGHVVFRDDHGGLLFAGDHILPHITPSIGFEPVSGPLPLGDYLTSLHLLQGYADTWLLPAHGRVTRSVHERVAELLDHHAQRLTVSLGGVLQGARTAYDVAAALRWTRRQRDFTELSPFNRMLAVLETKAHLDVLVDRGRLGRFEEEETVYYEAV